MQAEGAIRQSIERALRRAASEGRISLSDETPDKGINELGISNLISESLERPRDPSHGDLALTLPLKLARKAKKSPREIAAIIKDAMEPSPIVDSIEIAGPGFLNFKLSNAAFQNEVSEIRRQRREYGRGHVAVSMRHMNLEYISANPTGPLHVGHGRWAALGDSLARIMRHAGYEVFEEFYVNDHGNQMKLFAQSVNAFYMQILGHDAKFPEDGYGGSYVRDIAQEIVDSVGDTLIQLTEDERIGRIRDIAFEAMLENQRSVLARFGVSFDRWFLESTLYDKSSGESDIEFALRTMRERGYVFEDAGAVWFRSTAFGDDKDRVLIKADGEYTYLMSDVAYHYDKCKRGFDRLIDIWGADHHGYIKRLEAVVAAWGYPGILEVVLGQLVNLYRAGSAVRMSKRTGEMITFEELLDEVGPDATRYLMLCKSSDQQIDFDIETAKKRDASNPVYYVQYAHARICSILRRAAGVEDVEAGSFDELSLSLSPVDADLDLLAHESEIALMKILATFPELVSEAARDRAPYRLTHFAERLAGSFHVFYTQCKVINDDAELTRQRLALCDATRTLLDLTLSLIGVSAPVRM